MMTFFNFAEYNTFDRGMSNIMKKMTTDNFNYEVIIKIINFLVFKNWEIIYCNILILYITKNQQHLRNGIDFKYQVTLI